jgi:hypothetical protein
LKKIFFIFLAVSLLTAISLHAGKKKEVLLKFNKQESLLRIVFEADETFVNRIKVSTSSSQIKLDFPEPFDLTSQKDLPFQIVPSEKSVVITLKEKGEIKFFRLTAPARLVIDIQKMNMQTEKPPATVVSRGIVIDAGHGGYDFGITYGGVSEKDFTLSGKDLVRLFKEKGFSHTEGRPVYPDRRKDQFCEPEKSGSVHQFPFFFLKEFCPLFTKVRRGGIERGYGFLQPLLETEKIYREK